jgi:peptide-methionine (S)-S-oxide reductase
METIQIDYDPEKISYVKLLQVFFSSHNPTWPSPIRQYASAVMVHDEEQERLAKEAIEDAGERYGKKISTELLPFTGFTRAEDYHQKYYLRNTRALMDQYKDRFPNEDAFTDSTAIARVNGYIGGNGTTQLLEKEGSELGISTEGVEALRGILIKAGK